MHKVAVIIPARYDATRFPGKPLALLKGKPIIQHVFEQAGSAKKADTVLVATDDRRIYDSVTGFGGSAVMTAAKHQSGSDRIAEAAGNIECDFVINVQGDEPFVRPEMIDDVIDLLYNDDRVSISTLARRISDSSELISSDVVKVVTDDEGFALYFSRSPIPYHRDEWKNLNNISLADQHVEVFKHIGIYGYRKEALIRFASMPPGKVERIEKLEQLRALASGMRIKVKETEFDTLGIDTIDDLRKAEEWQSISL